MADSNSDSDDETDFEEMVILGAVLDYIDRYYYKIFLQDPGIERRALVQDSLYSRPRRI